MDVLDRRQNFKKYLLCKTVKVGGNLDESSKHFVLLKSSFSAPGSRTVKDNPSDSKSNESVKVCEDKTGLWRRMRSPCSSAREKELLGQTLLLNPLTNDPVFNMTKRASAACRTEVKGLMLEVS